MYFPYLKTVVISQPTTAPEQSLIYNFCIFKTSKPTELSFIIKAILKLIVVYLSHQIATGTNFS